MNGGPTVEITQQLAVFLENKPGTLARVCEGLAANRINIYAITTSDTVDHTVVRLVVSDPRRALQLFEEHATLVVEDDVLLVETDNQAGSLAEICRRLAAARVNIEYCYCATPPRARRGLLVLRVSRPSRALEILRGWRGSVANRRRGRDVTRRRSR
jgi:hypothetical protein